MFWKYVTGYCGLLSSSYLVGQEGDASDEEGVGGGKGMSVALCLKSSGVSKICAA